MAPEQPPHLVLILFRLLSPPEIRPELIGDLRERYAEIAAQQGVRAARRWAWRQGVALRPLQLRRAVRQARRARADEPGSHSGSDPLKGGAGVGGLWEDLGRAARSVSSRPGPSATVVLTVALAIGATTSVFSVVNGVLLRPLPYPDSERLVRIHQVKTDWLDSPNSQLRSFASRFPVSVPTLAHWSGSDLGLSAVGGWSDVDFVLRTGDGTEVVDGQMVTSGLFDALGVSAAQGRTLSPEDDRPGAPQVVVLSHGFRIERFPGDDVLGSVLTLDGLPHTVVGVMPPGFGMPERDARLWTPIDEESKLQGWQSQFLSVYGRLAPGVSLDEASVRAGAVQAALAEAQPEGHEGVEARLVPLADDVVGDVARTLWLLLGAVGLVLLIACANIANVLTVTALARRRELAVMSALGAGTRRLVRGMLLESGLLAVVGGAAGIALAWLSLPGLLRVIPPDVPRHGEIGLDPGVLGFSLAATAFTALAVGVVPALQAAACRPADAMRGSARGVAGDRVGGRIRSGLVVTELALAFVLLFGAGLLVASFRNLWTVERGFATEGVLLVEVEPDPDEYPEAEDRDRFVRLVRERMAAIPGVEVTAANQVPLGGGMSSTSYQVERPGREPEEVNVVISVVLPDYLEILRIPLLEGRSLDEADDVLAPPVAVVNEAMARTLWPGESPVGKRVRPWRSEDPEAVPWATVVGVAGNVRHQGLQVETEPKLYVSAWQNHRHPGTWVLRARGDLSAVGTLVREALAEVSPSTPVRWSTVLEEAIDRSVSVPRFRMIFSTGLAVLAGLLALVGVYGVVSFAVDQGRKEIGVRMALGADRRGVVRRVVGGGVVLAAWGVGIGLAGSLAIAGSLGDFLYEVEATDPVALGSIAVLVAVVGAVAAWLPARRAASIDPVAVLKSD